VSEQGWSKQHAIVAALVVGAGAIVLTAATLAGTGADAPEQAVPATEIVDPEPTEEPEPEPEETEGPEEVEEEADDGPRAPLTGVLLSDDQAATLASRSALIVKIPNDPSARPQTGLDRADVVYEQETEAGITRFVAVFHSELPGVVGNVRSARLADPALVSPYRGVMAFSGARPEVQRAIRDAGLTTVTEGGAGFFRDGARRAPHNLYVRAPETLAARDAEPAPDAGWAFAEEAPPGGRDAAGRVTASVSRSSSVGWEYDAGAGVYRRFQGGSAHRVTGEGVIGAANVVFLELGLDGRDSYGAPLYRFDGTGDALLLRDGQAYDVRWSKAGRDGAFELTVGDEPAVLKPGPTWIVLTYGGALPTG
jgi:hypothetical protein